jgi:hypothetical protein
MPVIEPVDRVAWALEKGEAEKWLSYTGLRLKGWLSQEDEESLVIFVAKMGDMGAWARGDLALYMRRKIDFRSECEGWSRQRRNEVLYESTEDLASELGVDARTLQTYASVCSAWPYEERVSGRVVGFSHHRLFCSWPKDERHDMLVLAEENCWTRNELARHAYGVRPVPVGVIPNSTRVESVGGEMPVWERPYAAEQWFYSHQIQMRQEDRDTVVFQSPWGVKVARAVLEGGNPVIAWEEGVRE